MDTRPGRRVESSSTTGSPANVLLRTPEDGPDPAPCPHGSGGRLLAVCLSRDPAARLAARRRRGGLPDEVAVLVDDETRSTAAERAPAPTATSGGTEISWATVDHAGDLSDIGVKINRCLDAWSDDTAPVEVCFDSISALLDHADLHTAFRFLHVLTRRIDTAGAIGHYHFDSERHGPRTITMLETLFEPIHEYDAGTASWVET